MRKQFLLNFVKISENKKRACGPLAACREGISGGSRMCHEYKKKYFQFIKNNLK